MKHLPRRTFLRGVGAAIALPVLDAMTPAFGKDLEGKAPERLMIVYAPNGMMPYYWFPEETGADFAFPRIMKPLERFRKDILVVSNLAHPNALALGDGSGDHSRAVASYLTGVHPKKTEGADIRCGVSVDQVAARKLGVGTRFASLEVTCEDSRQIGACDSYSCAYQSISWRSETQPLPPEMNPRSVFERLFGDADLSRNPKVRANQEAYRDSILDLTRRDTQALQRDLGPKDRSKLDEYLTAIREIEQRLDRANENNIELPEGMKTPAGIPPVFADHARILFDLITLAFQADLTRVVTFMLAREGGFRSYPEIGIPEAHHSITHHRGNKDWIEKITQVNCYHSEQFAYFLDKLSATPEGDGTLLDHSVITYGASIGEPNRHDHLHLPTLLAGNVKGKIKTGRHVQVEEKTPMSNLHLSLLRLLGVEAERFGDSTGELSHLTNV
jgi:hypothetical protein